MSTPQPASSLDGRCSAIDNGILYVLSSDSFQSLPLKENATWSTLKQGTTVSGPACVRAVPNGDESQAALYVVGGTSQDSSYQGLQRYFFKNETWETLTPPTANMQGRTSHSAAFLNDSSSILVYAGSQPSSASISNLSSQTFLISTIPPYNIRSYTSEAPPSSQPVLLPWSSTDAVMVGGSTANTQVWTFNPDNGWSQQGTSLSQGLGSEVQATLVAGDDGSKVLEVYDAGASPNTVQQLVLLGAGGKNATTGQTIGSSSAKRKRDLTLQDWPSYNTSLAPSTIRSQYSVAQDANGMAVIYGGNDKSPLDLFNEQTNSWIDDGLFFTGKSNSNQVPLVNPTSSSSSSSPTSTHTSAASSSAASSSGGGGNHHMLKILGITLGVLCGIAACFIIALLLIRYRRQKRQRKQGYVDEKADRMSFQDRGASFMKEAGGSTMNLNDVPPNHRFAALNNSSHNSFTMMAGRLGGGNRNSRNNAGNNGGKGSSESTRQLVKPDEYGAPVELDNMNEKHIYTAARDEPGAHTPTGMQAGDASMNPDGRKRSSGWSSYFAHTDPQVPTAYGARNQHQSNATSTYTSDNPPSMPSRIPSSILVAPLNIDFTRGLDGQRLSFVAQKSPSYKHSTEDLSRGGSSLDAARGQRAHIGYAGEDRLAPNSHESMQSETNETTTSRSYSEVDSDFDSSDRLGNDSSSTSAWTPVSASHFGKPTVVENIPRPPSSNYTASVYGDRVVSARGNTGFFPGNRDAYRPTSRSKIASTTSQFPAPPTSSSGGLGLSGSRSNLLQVDGERDSTMTVFPRGVPSAYYANRNQADAAPAKEIPPQDMSWLNLGLNRV